VTRVDRDLEARVQTAAPGPLPHMPVLDGLRTLAVVPVVLFHAWSGTFPGGFIGVDLFFVISGYLITSILLRERTATGRIRLPAFWGRRFRRLVPAVVVLVSVCSLVAAAVGAGSALAFVDAIGALTWTQNWVHLWASTTGWGSPRRRRGSTTCGRWRSRSSSTWCGRSSCWPSAASRRGGPGASLWSGC
jgi:peptidoglycan/LPS O-acetylase OafA/YrhL